MAALQSVIRIILATLLSVDCGPALDSPVSDDVAMFINIMFFVIGGFGLLTTLGLWTGKKWGYTGTIALSLVTIVFDVWAVLAVQSSAAMGLVLPTIFIVYLVWIRHDLTGGERQ
ncbi:MAG: DUF2127 domain-containing protein [Methanomassiliicoccales archaeon]|nr:DUF2127 domain-containing protein [Methanomassiliicoccales archaeon]